MCKINSLYFCKNIFHWCLVVYFVSILLNYQLNCKYSSPPAIKTVPIFHSERRIICFWKHLSHVSHNFQVEMENVIMYHTETHFSCGTFLLWDVSNRVEGDCEFVLIKPRKVLKKGAV